MAVSLQNAQKESVR